MTVDSVVEKFGPMAVELRHRLHRIPELMYEEHKTAAEIRAELKRLGIEFTADVADAPTATMATLGPDGKPCIALRADIDALPIQENTGLPYASIHAGKMHACGHDGHAATLLGVAAALKAMSSELPLRVKLIWQPAEEGGAGAARLVSAGVLDGRIGPKVDAIFGLHGWPGLKIGTIATKPGELLAATDNFEATFIGQGCHGAFPHLGRDPIVAACEAVTNLQQCVSREFDPTESAVVTVGIIRGGTATNIIPDRAVIEGTARTLSEPSRKKIAGAIRRRCQAIAAAGDCTLEFQWLDGYPPTVNDPKMAELVAKTAKAVFGGEIYFPVPRPCMGGEDFAYYLEKIPGCFFLVGVDSPDETDSPSLHTDRYNFSDGAVGIGMRMFLELVLRFSDL